MRATISDEQFTTLEAQYTQQQTDALALLNQPPRELPIFVDAARNPQGVLLLGTGSSHHINRAVEPLYRSIGIHTHATPITELLASPLGNWSGTVFVTSQSGDSIELKQYLAQPSVVLEQHYGLTLNPHGFLAQHLPCQIAPGGPELGLVATRGFLLGVLLHLRILRQLGLEDAHLHAVLNRLPPNPPTAMLEALRAAPVVFFVTSGVLQGVAEYAAVFLMELTRKPCFAISLAQYEQSPFAQSAEVCVVHLANPPEAQTDATNRQHLTLGAALSLETVPAAVMVAQILNVQHILLQTAKESTP